MEWLTSCLLVNCFKALSNTASLLPYLFTLSNHLLKKYLRVNKLFLSSQFSINDLMNLIVFKKLQPVMNWSFATLVNLFLNASFIAFILNPFLNLLLTKNIKLLFIYISYLSANFFQFSLAFAILYLSSSHFAIFCLVASPPLSFAFLCHCKSFILNKFWLASSPINKYLPSVLNILKRNAFQSSYIVLILFKNPLALFHYFYHLILHLYLLQNFFVLLKKKIVNQN